MHIAVNQIQYDCLKEISDMTGKSIKSCLEDALDDYIRTIGPTVASHNEFFNILLSPGVARPVTEYEIN